MELSLRLVFLYLMFIHVPGTFGTKEYIMNCDTKKTGCPMIINGSEIQEGVLRSNNSESLYPKGIRCDYTINIPQHHMIIFTKEYFNLYRNSETSPHCENRPVPYTDRLYIEQKCYDSIRQIPKVLSRLKRTVNLKFHTTKFTYIDLKRNQYVGFVINFKIVYDVTAMPNIQKYRRYDYIASPNYPNTVGKEIQATISAEEGQRLQFHIIDVTSGNCNQHSQPVCCSSLIITNKDDVTCNMTKDATFILNTHQVGLKYQKNLPGSLIKFTVLGCSSIRIPIQNSRINATKAGKIAKLSCKDDYVMKLANGSYTDEDVTIRCKKNDWIITNSTCISNRMVSCDNLNSFPNGSYRDNKTTTHNTIVHVECNTGYEQVSGDATRRCTAQQIWSGKEPVCSPISDKTTEEKDSIGLIVGVIVGTVLLIVLVLVIVFIIRKKHCLNKPIKPKGKQQHTTLAYSPINKTEITGPLDVPSSEDGQNKDVAEYDVITEESILANNNRTHYEETDVNVIETLQASEQRDTPVVDISQLYAVVDKSKDHSGKTFDYEQIGDTDETRDNIRQSDIETVMVDNDLYAHDK